MDYIHSIALKWSANNSIMVEKNDLDTSWSYANDKLNRQNCSFFWKFRFTFKVPVERKAWKNMRNVFIFVILWKRAKKKTKFHRSSFYRWKKIQKYQHNKLISHNYYREEPLSRLVNSNRCLLILKSVLMNCHKISVASMWSLFKKSFSSKLICQK